ncbi:MAG: hypothetical protein AAF351_15730 [Pseudomonadota bacterium]
MNTDNPDSALQAEFDKLRAATPSQSVGDVLARISNRAHSKRRQVVWAVTGALLATAATALFVVRGDWLGYFVLPLVAVVFGIVALRSAKEATHLAELEPGRSLVDSWRSEVNEQLRHINFGLWIGVLFSALTAWVFIRHGMNSGRAWIYGVTAIVIGVYVIYQWLVVRPLLQCELKTLDKTD